MTRLALAVGFAVAALLGSAYAGWSIRGHELDRVKAQHAQQIADARAQALAESARITHRIQEAQDAEHLKRKDAEASARRAVSAAVSLRTELAATREHVSGLDWELASSRETAAATVAMLTDLLEQCSDRRRELAQFADEAASAGRLCERSFDALKVRP